MRVPDATNLFAMPDRPTPTSVRPVVPLESLLSAIASPTRWDILRELAGGDQCAVVELADRLGRSPTAISKHMTVLLKAKMVNLGRNRLYSIAPPFIADKEQRILDFGWCLLRLSAG